MKLSVILCTYNRARTLRAALGSIAASQVPRGVDWEVLVIDNNSRDKTRELVEEYCVRFPQVFRYIFEARQGKSYALNTGLREASGDVIAFMDDDVSVDPTWLQNLTEPLQGGAYMGAGGMICAPKEVMLPPWISVTGRCSLAGVLALFDRGPVRIELTDPPYGTNMAFRREMFDKYGVFRTDLGPSAGSEIRGEDTEFCLRLMKLGIPLIYVPDAIVHHEVPKERLRKAYFLRWYFDYGRSLIRTGEPKPDVAGIPRPLIRILNHLLLLIPKQIVQWLVTLKPTERFFAKTQLWMLAGETVEIHNQWLIDKAQRGEAKPRALGHE